MEGSSTTVPVKRKRSGRGRATRPAQPRPYENEVVQLVDWLVGACRDDSDEVRDDDNDEVAQKRPHISDDAVGILDEIAQRTLDALVDGMETAANPKVVTLRHNDLHATLRAKFMCSPEQEILVDVAKSAVK